MTYFPFTFQFNVPGLSNPFGSSAPAASEVESECHEHRGQTQSDKKRPKRSASASASGAQTERASLPVAYRRHQPPSGPPPARLVRKRGWQPSSLEPSRAAIIAPSTTGIFDTVPMYHQDMSDVHIKGNDVELELPPSKRRKGITETVISTAFNAALVSAAVGLTVFRMWADRGKEVEQAQSPPPPYEEEWASNRNAITEPESDTTRSGAFRAQKGLTPASLHRRHAGSVRHRPKAVRKTNAVRRDKDLSPKKPSPQIKQEGFSDHSPIVRHSVTKEDPLDEMDWIGDRLAQLIVEGKRALGTEIVAASEAPEDEVDDGSGNWVEEEAEESRSLASSSKRVIPNNQPTCSSYTVAHSVPASSTPHRSILSHSRFHSDDLTASLPSTPNQSLNPTFESGAGSTSLLSRTYDAESPSIRESMERARAAYRQKRGLALDRQGTRV